MKFPAPRTCAPLAAWLLAATLGYLSSGIVAAQDGETEVGPETSAEIGGDAELDLLEDQYLAEVVKARRELADKYLAALQRLQDTLTQSGKLEDALLVKQERERTLELLEKRPELGGSQAGQALGEPVFLPGSEASVQGKLRLSPANGALFAWEKKGTYAEWILPKGMVPGDYEVILHYSAAEGEGGSFDVGLDDKQVLAASVIGEEDWGTWRDIHVGNLAVGPAGGKLRVTATSFANVRLMNLQHIVLGPKGTWEKISNGESIAPVAAPGLPPKEKEKASETFTKIDNARFVARPTNTGDGFALTDGEMEYLVRLYFVETPPAGAGSVPGAGRRGTQALEDWAAAFGITPDDAAVAGTEAAAYVARLLTGQSLTLYTRHERDPRSPGSEYGIVVVGGKPLSTLLVENGFARIEGKTTDLPNGSDAAAYAEALNKAEGMAKSLRRGAWGKVR